MEKNRGGFLMKQIMSSLGRAKSWGRLLKNKANALRTRLIIFSLLRDKRLMTTTSITQKIHSLTSHANHHRPKEEDDNIKSPSTIVLYNENRTMTLPAYEEAYSDDEKYPDLTHSLFESDMDPGSVIEMVKNEKGEEFKLEEEIDRVADLFIERFHRQMRLQSIKRYQEMSAA